MQTEPFQQQFRPRGGGVLLPTRCFWCHAPATWTETLTWSTDYLREGETAYAWCAACLPVRQTQGVAWPTAPPAATEGGR